MKGFLVGGWTNPFQKYESKWESSPNRDGNKKYFKPPPWFSPSQKCWERVMLTGKMCEKTWSTFSQLVYVRYYLDSDFHTRCTWKKVKIFRPKTFLKWWCFTIMVQRKKTWKQRSFTKKIKVYAWIGGILTFISCTDTAYVREFPHPQNSLIRWAPNSIIGVITQQAFILGHFFGQATFFGYLKLINFNGSSTHRYTDRFRIQEMVPWLICIYLHGWG